MRQFILYFCIASVAYVLLAFYSFKTFYKQNIETKIDDKKTLYFLVTLIMLFAIFYCEGDYWSYRFWFESGIENEHYEQAWSFIRDLVPFNFEIFRTLVWGTALGLFVAMCKRCDINLVPVLCLFGVFYIEKFAYARATLAYMFILFAYCYVYTDGSKKSSSIFKVFVITFMLFCGYSLHRSMPILIAILVTSSLFSCNKRSVVILLLSFPLAASVFNQLVSYIPPSLIESEQAGYLQLYLAKEVSKTDMLKDMTKELPMLILYGVSLWNLLKLKAVPKHIKKISSAVLLIIYTAFLFFSMEGSSGFTLFYRTLYMSYPFILILTSYTIENVKKMRTLSLILIVYQFYHIFYWMLYQMTHASSTILKAMSERYLM